MVDGQYSNTPTYLQLTYLFLNWQFELHYHPPTHLLTTYLHIYLTTYNLLIIYYLFITYYQPKFLNLPIYSNKAKNPIKTNGRNRHTKDKNKGQIKVKKHVTHMNYERRELVLLVVGGYLTHGPFNVTCMQIMRSKNNRRSRPM